MSMIDFVSVDQRSRSQRSYMLIWPPSNRLGVMRKCNKGVYLNTNTNGGWGAYMFYKHFLFKNTWPPEGGVSFPYMYIRKN